MMTLDIIDSGSKANGYVLHNESEAIIIECGCPLLECEKILNFNISKVKAVLISHEHGDHARFAKQYASNALKICSTKGTLDAIGIDKTFRREMRLLSLHRFGDFLVMPFKTQHDAVDPCGFLIDCPDGNRIVFATDTYYLRYTFPRVNYYMIECNYSKEILKSNVKNGIIHPTVAKRITESHMSDDRCMSTLIANDLSETKGIILLHGSRDNSSERKPLIDKIQKITGRAVYIAQKKTNLTLL
ncbi:Phosphoribosyl 1,2-cyclic phosphodiesterase [Prevotella sp. tc2-28]|uniref:MBL fold metallo-hydrolase n=1 Tax=Prevotella sp. tc2-28 TaxID=1761888 RepID=UPI00089DA0D7|nr:MBL fold metallo-hydrolase [Prevotella sp. tc2-28]SEA78571.1 Phosphoribosyl 1,2-cyclic phosphodiesterase [Prevotella sp. tc2-28]